VRQSTQQDHENMRCGYIKAKFEFVDGWPLGEHDSYKWCCSITRPRVTLNFIYIALGHELLPSNELARQYITSIRELGGKITRIDFCIDYLGKLAFDSFYKLHDNKQKPTPSILRSPAGVTVYVGKRSSARMLRVYDKRGEIKVKEKVDIGFDLTRIEIEIKREMVSRYVSLFMSGKTDAILSDIQSLYGLRGFCELHKSTKPLNNRKKDGSLWSFVTRFRRILKRAYLTDVDEFLDILEVNDNE